MSLLFYLPQFLQGLWLTIVLMVSSVAIGFALAVIMTTILFLRPFLLEKIVKGVVFFIRGTPLLVQIFLIYYGTAQFAWLRHSPLWVIFREPIACAIIAFSINTAAYTTVLLTGAINSMPKNEVSACYALGMSKWLALRRVIFPRAFRIVLPAYSNEVLIILKGTSLASTITITELMDVTQKIISETYETVPFYLFAGLLYLLLNGIIVALFKIAQRYANSYQNGAMR